MRSNPNDILKKFNALKKSASALEMIEADEQTLEDMQAIKMEIDDLAKSIESDLHGQEKMDMYRELCEIIAVYKLAPSDIFITKHHKMLAEAQRAHVDASSLYEAHQLYQVRVAFHAEAAQLPADSVTKTKIDSFLQTENDATKIRAMQHVVTGLVQLNQFLVSGEIKQADVSAVRELYKHGDALAVDLCNKRSLSVDETYLLAHSLHHSLSALRQPNAETAKLLEDDIVAVKKQKSPHWKKFFGALCVVLGVVVIALSIAGIPYTVGASLTGVKLGTWLMGAGGLLSAAVGTGLLLTSNKKSATTKSAVEDKSDQENKSVASNTATKSKR